MSDFYFDPNNRCRFPLVEALSDPALNQELEKVKREGGEEALKALIRERFPHKMPLLYPEDEATAATPTAK